MKMSKAETRALCATEWEEHRETDPLWESERKAQAEKRARKKQMAKIRANTAKRATANTSAAAAATTAAPTSTSTATARVSQSSLPPSWNGGLPTPPPSRSASPAKQLPANTPLANLFDDDEDVIASTTKTIQQPSAFVNGKAGCYQNTVLHLLSSIPAFVAMGTQEPPLGAKSGGIAPSFAQMMYDMLHNDSNQAISTTGFQTACSEVFGNAYDGRSQQDADEFLLRLIAQLHKERPDLKLESQFDATFVRTANCTNCGAEKKIIDSDLSLTVPMNATSSIPLNEILDAHVEDTSDFAYRACDNCKSTGDFATNDEAARKRMRRAPAFLKVTIPRHDWKYDTAAKNRTKVSLPRCCSFLGEDGDVLRYDLVAATGHGGRTASNGHYMALRRLDNKWFQCDSAGFKGVRQMKGPDFDHNSTQVTLCLFKRVGVN